MRADICLRACSDLVELYIFPYLLIRDIFTITFITLGDRLQNLADSVLILLYLFMFLSILVSL